ncbi:class I SAM-dependent methyltransferase [Mameliella alba]|uniref:class I SAM-dependent methyltransferase n=1 Tax=Mameliella alba TaxID=561184 RepID=UPI0020945B39|nr:class I SAM-dependent methyltransferase [Mameliella alba]
MVSVKEQYESYPYPERRPEDEKKRLITGSPSHPLEIDHYLFGGQRDWSQPLRVLVAGGGTGDALIQIAQMMTSARAPYEITYADLSTASREIAEARAKARGLTGITFVTGSLLDAAELGQFDYIDCCGVLHHLPDPDAGFAALRAAVAPGAGWGSWSMPPMAAQASTSCKRPLARFSTAWPRRHAWQRRKRSWPGCTRGTPLPPTSTSPTTNRATRAFTTCCCTGRTRLSTFPA